MDQYYVHQADGLQTITLFSDGGICDYKSNNGAITLETFGIVLMYDKKTIQKSDVADQIVAGLLSGRSIDELLKEHPDVSINNQRAVKNS